jgi:hypothetical protein
MKALLAIAAALPLSVGLASADDRVLLLGPAVYVANAPGEALILERTPQTPRSLTLFSDPAVKKLRECARWEWNQWNKVCVQWKTWAQLVHRHVELVFLTPLSSQSGKDTFHFRYEGDGPHPVISALQSDRPYRFRIRDVDGYAATLWLEQ